MPTAERFPPEKVVVEAITESGNQVRLVMERGLWFVEDRSMYVYYVPVFWREVTPTTAALDNETLEARAQEIARQAYPLWANHGLSFISETKLIELLAATARLALTTKENHG